MRETFDCVVLGGGPAGSTVAALVADANFSTLLVEREKMPRFHVGESLMPETYWTLRRLGVLEQMKHSVCPKKFSVQFVNDRGKSSKPFYFFQHDSRECSQTWQVRRSEFDQMLYENAASKGATCRDQTRALNIDFRDADQPAERKISGIQLLSADGAKPWIDARVVVDATGQQSLIANRLGIRREDPSLRKASIWTYYHGAQRDAGVDEGATIILQTKNKNSWFWIIPLANDVTSIGVVGDYDYLLRNRGNPEAIFAAELQNCPALGERIDGARCEDPFRVAREFSYTSDVLAGDGWVLVGDAYGFVDPIYSSGVFLAMKSAELAADCILEGFAQNDTSASQLGAWGPDYDAGVTHIRKLVDAFYTNDFSFGDFLKEYPHHVGNLTDILIGRVFHPSAGDLFEDMDPAVAAARGGCS